MTNSRFQKFLKKYIFIALPVILLASCATKDEIVYFQNIEKLDNMEALQDFEPQIQVNDVLQIDISSKNDLLLAPYRFNNLQSGGGSRGGGSDAPIGFLVDAQGTINYPGLGEVFVENRTTRELEKYLTNELREFVTDVVVRVRITNFKVTVLGETGSSVIQVPDERITIPQVIAMSGDISYNGKRENILVIRTTNGKPTYGRVDLTDADVFNNPFYFLKQNDIVYVEPTYRTVKSAGYITNWREFVSIITTGISLYFIYLSL